MIKVRRIYEPPGKEDGFRVLVDRLWPRGVSKGKSQVDLWLREIAPSYSLRKWFSHQPNKWGFFKKRYEAELSTQRESMERVKQAERENGTVTLLYAAKDRKRNNAVALKGFLRKLPRV